jgi:predicted outer membrane repeat protein
MFALICLQATAQGGAVVCNPAELCHFEDTRMESNTAGEGGLGGAVYAEQTKQLTFLRSVIINNTVGEVP